jgi:CHAT domain-containing protein
MSGSQVTIEALISQLPGASVLHFAGHAINSQQHSGLLLSDGLLGASSLKKTSLTRIQLAVFSACDTQDGSTGRIYDVDGLVRVFLRAGVPHVVASRWNVNSAATRQFMNLFYRALLDGNSVAESVHRAQVGLRSISGMTHPYYWSAFTNFGLV